MSHKNYVALAAALASARKNLDTTGGPESRAEARGFDLAVVGIANALHRDNLRFDFERFFAAARGEPVTGRDRPRG
jgi:hypothetical protein